jgi:steroid delta-isomerase-like uncharacterized protein
MRSFIISLTLAAGLMPCFAQAQGNKQNNVKEVTMSDNERNKEAVRQLFEEVINKGRTELLKDLVADDYIGARGEKGAAGYQATTAGLITAFPDIHYRLEELVSADDKVAVRWVWTGTHKATFVGPVTTIPATGIFVSNEGMAIYEFRNGKVASVRLQTDRLGFLQQLGIVPANPAAAPARAND